MSRLKIMETQKQIITRKRLSVMIRLLRASLGLTQRQLAKAAGLSFSAVAKVERGELRLSDATLSTLLSIFNHDGLFFHQKEDEIKVTLSHGFLKTLYGYRYLAVPLD